MEQQRLERERVRVLDHVVDVFLGTRAHRDARLQRDHGEALPHPRLLRHRDAGQRAQLLAELAHELALVFDRLAPRALPLVAARPADLGRVRDVTRKVARSGAITLGSEPWLVTITIGCLSTVGASHARGTPSTRARYTRAEDLEVVVLAPVQDHLAVDGLVDQGEQLAADRAEARQAFKRLAERLVECIGRRGGRCGLRGFRRGLRGLRGR